MKKINVEFELTEGLDGIEVRVRASEPDDEVNAVIDKIRSSVDSERYIRVDGKDKVIDMVPVSDIILLSVNNKFLSIVTGNDRYTSRQTLIGIEEALDPQMFVRVSRYEIVNLAKVVRYDFTLSGTLRIELTNGMETWASRRCIPLIRKKLLGKE